MNLKKLKVLFICFLILIFILFILSRALTPKNSDDLKKSEDPVVVKTVDIDNTFGLQKIDYNNLTQEQMEYFINMYGDTVGFTEDGVEVYMEKAFSGKPKKVITSRWPEASITSICIKPDFGEISRIEYSDTKLEAFINNAKAGDLSGYMKNLKKLDYKQKENKKDGNVFTEYLYENKNGDVVRGRYYKSEKRAEILVKKAS